MANKRYGLKEVANVVFFNIETGKPEIFFDTLKVSTIENESESAEARGGQGNAPLISWDYGRTATLTMQDALLSDVSLAMLSGNPVENGSKGIKVVGREELTVENGVVYLADSKDKEDNKKEDNKIDVTTIENVSIMKVVKGVIDPTDEVTYELVMEEVTDELTGEVTKKFTGEVNITAGAEDGDTVMVFYEYTINDPNANKITFSADAFPHTYRVVGDTYGKDQQGQLRRMQFVIPRAKLQSTFSLTMDVENVSVFDFNLDVLVDPETNKLYEIITL